ncbi:hypothetical protein HYZ41_01710 [archaeon]|nr:hypothetical protein [archaeon]
MVNKKSTNEIFIYTDKFSNDSKGFIRIVLDSIPYYNDIGYAGYRSKTLLKKFLPWFIFGKEQIKWKNIEESEIKKIIEKTLELCKPFIKNNYIRIFVFPTVNRFVIERMNGVGGFSFWKNTIILTVYPSSNWKRTLKETVCHEMAHALSLNYVERKTLLDGLVFEGVAEHFREYVAGGKRAPWSGSLSRKQALEIFTDIKGKMKSTKYSTYSDVFYGAGKYPLWAGYAIGYYIVEDYLKKQEKVDWIKILKTRPESIMKKSGIWR